MTYFEIGNLTIPSIWLAAVISLFIGSLFKRLYTREKVGEWYWNGFFLYFLVWKLSYVLFNFKIFLNMPLSVVYFNGGTTGHILALASLSFYILFMAGIKHPSIYSEGVPVFLFYFISYEVVISLLEQNYMEALVHFVLLASCCALFNHFKNKNSPISKQIFILIFLLELLIFSFFQSFLTLETLTFTWIAVTMLILYMNPKRRDNCHE